jgi:5-methyltetrahydropteroyltriglutamate--homocysteine methyltransferase
MQLSIDRILATHVGSLPRRARLSELLIEREAGGPAEGLAAEIDRAVRDVVGRQLEAGIDVGNDGEQQRVGFQTYVPQRMRGFGGASRRRRPRDFEAFPELTASMLRRFPQISRTQDAPECQGDLQYLGTDAIEAEAARLRDAAAGRFADTFMTAPSPGIIASTMLDAHYGSHDAYLTALSREMRHEYAAIHDAGLLLQIDAPDLGMDRAAMFRDLDDAAFVRATERHVAAINEGIAGIPRERVRLHVCYGNYDGPHVHDVALETILPVLYEAQVGALSLALANPRHAHEYAALKRHPLPASMVLIAGVVETTHNIVEHPEVIARRITEAVDAVGDRERVIASTDCGFGTFTNREWVMEPVVWLKLRALGEGAALASARLWGRRA